jgi:hypothetical protein
MPLVTRLRELLETNVFNAEPRMVGFALPSMQTP